MRLFSVSGCRYWPGRCTTGSAVLRHSASTVHWCDLLSVCVSGGSAAFRTQEHVLRPTLLAEEVTVAQFVTIARHVHALPVLELPSVPGRCLTGILVFRLPALSVHSRGRCGDCDVHSHCCVTSAHAVCTRRATIELYVIAFFGCCSLHMFSR